MPANTKESTAGQCPPAVVAGGDGSSPMKGTAVDVAACKGDGTSMPTFGTMKPGVSFKNVVTLNASPAVRKYDTKQVHVCSFLNAI